MTNTDNGGLVWFDAPAGSEPPRATRQLSRERIVAAAVALADETPRGEVTMRALTARLGVRSPMALYRYVGSKDGLADLMADHCYGLLAVPRGQGWPVALHGLGISGWQAVRRHPWFARLAFARPPLGPHALRVYDDALAELEPLGLAAATRMRFLNTVLGHVFGAGLALLEEQAMRAGTVATEGNPATDADLAAAAAPYLARIADAGEHPYFSRWAADPDRDALDTPGNGPFEQTLEWLLDGLASLV